MICVQAEHVYSRGLGRFKPSQCHRHTDTGKQEMDRFDQNRIGRDEIPPIVLKEIRTSLMILIAPICQAYPRLGIADNHCRHPHLWEKSKFSLISRGEIFVGFNAADEANLFQSLIEGGRLRFIPCF